MSIDPSTLVWMIINFILLMILLNQFLYKPVLAFMKKRQDKIDEGIQAGEKAARLLEEKRAELAAGLTEARGAANSRFSELSRQLEQEQAANRHSSDVYAEKRLTEIAGALFAEEEYLAAATENHIPDYVAILQRKVSAMNSASPVAVSNTSARDEFLQRIIAAGGNEGAEE